MLHLNEVRTFFDGLVVFLGGRNRRCQWLKKQYFFFFIDGTFCLTQSPCRKGELVQLYRTLERRLRAAAVPVFITHRRLFNDHSVGDWLDTAVVGPTVEVVGTR